MHEPFNGTWSIDIQESFVWDDKTKRHVPDKVGEEVITLDIQGNVQTYEVLYGDRPKIRMGYTATYDDTTWTEYAVRAVIPETDNPEEEIRAFKARINANDGARERHFEVGRSYGQIRLAYVDRMTHYRISRDPDTKLAQSVMLRRMAEDERSYLATVLDTSGIVFRIRKFVRVA